MSDQEGATQPARDERAQQQQSRQPERAGSGAQRDRERGRRRHGQQPGQPRRSETQLPMEELRDLLSARASAFISGEIRLRKILTLRLPQRRTRQRLSLRYQLRRKRRVLPLLRPLRLEHRQNRWRRKRKACTLSPRRLWALFIASRHQQQNLSFVSAATSNRTWSFALSKP